MVDPSATPEEAATDPDAHDAMPFLEPLDEEDAVSDPFDQHSPRTRAMILDETPPATPSVASVQPEFEPGESDADDAESEHDQAKCRRSLEFNKPPCCSHPIIRLVVQL